MSILHNTTSDKLARLRSSLAKRGRVLVAYSGGVDSAFLAAVAKDVLGDGALCVILDSETLPRSELEHALALAKDLGLRLRVASYPLAEGDYAHNPPERCYLCKRGSARLLKSLASGDGIDTVADGVNLSDLGEHRPGLRACDEAGVWHPLAGAGLNKEDIRSAAREMGLPVWSKPSTACLATRIPYGDGITPEKLSMVERAEDLLREMGFLQVRVRIHGNLARIEVAGEKMDALFRCREALARDLKEIGFAYVTLDLEGFRSGSMDLAPGDPSGSSR